MNNTNNNRAFTTTTTTTIASTQPPSSITVLSQTKSRAQRMDPIDSRETPNIIQRQVQVENSNTRTIFDIVTNKSKVLAHAFGYMLRTFQSSVPVETFGLATMDCVTRGCQMNRYIWQRLRKTEFFLLQNHEGSNLRTIVVPFEVKSLESEIKCFGDFLDHDSFLEHKFVKIGNLFQSIWNHHDNLLFALKNNFIDKTAGVNSTSISQYFDTLLEALFLFSNRCRFLVTCFSKITPTSLNAYLIYETLLTEYFTVAGLFHVYFSKSDAIWFPQIIEIVAIELYYIVYILEDLKPYAIKAYTTLGYDEADFIDSDIQMLQILHEFNTSLIPVSLKEGVEQEPVSVTSSCVHKKPKKKSGKNNKGNRKKKAKKSKINKSQKPAVKKLEERKIEQNSSLSTSISMSSIPSPEQIEFEKQRALRQEEWNNVQKEKEQQRIERKKTFAKKVTSEHQSAVELTEQKKLDDRVANTKILFDLPSREQCKIMYEQLSTHQRDTFDCLFTAEAFSITSEDIVNLVKKLKELMIELGFDLSTIKEFKREVLNRNHSAHNSSDTGNKLPEDYIRKRVTSFIIFGFFPPDWKPTSFDEYESLQIYEQRNIVRQLKQL